MVVVVGGGVMRLKLAWEVCREVGLRAQSLLFENGPVVGGFVSGRVGVLTISGFFSLFFWGGFVIFHHTLHHEVVAYHRVQSFHT